MPLNLTPLAYLESAESFRLRKISETGLKKIVLNSLEREFEEQIPLLTSLKKELYDQSWLEWLHHCYEVNFPSSAHVKNLILTNGHWEQNGVNTLLEC